MLLRVHPEWHKLHFKLPSRLLQLKLKLCVMPTVLHNLPAARLRRLPRLPSRHVLLRQLLRGRLPIEHHPQVWLLHIGLMPAIELYSV
jgi:hypothetical protein